MSLEHRFIVVRPANFIVMVPANDVQRMRDRGCYDVTYEPR